MAMDLSTLKGIWDCAILSLMAGYGLRVSGVVAFNKSSLIWIELDGKERLAITVRKKGNKGCVIPATFDVLLILRAFLQRGKSSGGFPCEYLRRFLAQ